MYGSTLAEAYPYLYFNDIPRLQEKDEAEFKDGLFLLALIGLPLTPNTPFFGGSSQPAYYFKTADFDSGRKHWHILLNAYFQQKKPSFFLPLLQGFVSSTAMIAHLGMQVMEKLMPDQMPVQR